MKGAHSTANKGNLDFCFFDNQLLSENLLSLESITVSMAVNLSIRLETAPYTQCHIS